ncbi:hypothetical protein BGZ81_005663 [Podila clonocystis]|nr:hypothetical protein BGZ81_005663 [Podila clonocystis]
MSKSVANRLNYHACAPLTEANLYKFTVQSPPTRDAKLKHILVYVELQRELIALEEELYRNVAEKGIWHTKQSSNSTLHPTRSDLTIEPRSAQTWQQHDHTQYVGPAALSTPAPTPPHRQQQQHNSPGASPYHRNSVSLSNGYNQEADNRTPSPKRTQHFHQPSYQTQPSYHYQRLQTPSPRDRNHVPDGLDPSMALPRALPKSANYRGQSHRRDSFYSGIGGGPDMNDWRHLEELDPDSLAGIQIYADTDLATSPVNKYPTYEYTPKQHHKHQPSLQHSEDWKQEQHQQQLQQQSIFRQLQCQDDDDLRNPVDNDGSRHRRQASSTLHQNSLHHNQTSISTSLNQHQGGSGLARQDSVLAKVKKAGRFSRFSFLTRRKNQRHESVPVQSKEPWAAGNNTVTKNAGRTHHEICFHDDNPKFHSLNHRSGGQLAAALPTRQGENRGDGVEVMAGRHTPEQDSQPPSEPTPSKPKSKVKQMFKDMFGKSPSTSNLGQTKKTQQPYRDITLPSTALANQELHLQQQHRYLQQHHHSQGRPLSPPVDSSTPHPYSNQAHLPYPSHQQQPQPQSQPQPQPQPQLARATPVSTSGTPPSSYYPSTRARESLVDPAHVQQFVSSFHQKSELGESEHDMRDNDSGVVAKDPSRRVVHPPFGTKPSTSLNPPPASLMLRHSINNLAGYVREHNNEGVQGEATAVKAATATVLVAVEASDEANETGPGADPGSAGGRLKTRRSSQLLPAQEYVVDALAQSNYSTVQRDTIVNTNQGQQGQQDGFRHQFPSYDNGPTLMAPVQMADLEGLKRQSHPPQSHPHHMQSGMVQVPVESLYA